MIDRKLLMRWDQRIWYIWTTSKPWNHWLIQLIMRLWKLNSSLVVTYAMLSRICFFLRWSDHNVWLSDYTEWLMNGEFSSKNRHQSSILSPTMRHIVRISLWHCICHGDTCPLNSAFLHHATFTAINWYYAYFVCSFHSTT